MIHFCKIALLIISLCQGINVFSNTTTNLYAVDRIPKNLLINASAVIRVDEMVYTIENNKYSKMKFRHAITLLNEQASDYRKIRIPYNSFSSIGGIKATVYDNNGNIILSAKPEIFEMNSNNDELATDLKFWIISFPLRKYPYTIEYEYEQKNNESFFYEDWSFQSQPDVSIEQSGAQYIMPKNLGFRIKELNLKHKCDTVSFNDKIMYTWQEDNIPAYKPKDLFLINFSKKAPVLLTAPTTFTMGGYDGNMGSWNSFGKWYYELNKDRDHISTEFKSKLTTLVSNEHDQKNQIKILYDYLQKNTRYVSIQLGIGGYQTLPAEFVEKKGFGDCKALTNYMKAMLKSVGINSYQALVSTDSDDDFYVDFPSQQFNHVILCVPLQRDTIWLECTNQSIPFNFLGSFTQNRNVLLLKESGGEMVRTPEYGINANFQNSNIDVKISSTGDAEFSGKMIFSGLNYEIPLAHFKESKKLQEKWVNNLFDSPNIDIDTLYYKEKSNSFPSIEVFSNLKIRGFASKTKKRLIFNPNLFVPLNFIPKFEDNEFSIQFSRSRFDSIAVIIPVSYTLNNLPQSQIIESKFGKYQIHYQLIKDKLVYTRQFSIYRNSFDKNDIEPFRNFANSVARADRSLVVFQKDLN